MNKGIIQRHTGQFQTHNLCQGEDAIDTVQDFRGLGLLGYQLGEDRTGALRLGQVVRADTERGYDSSG